MLRFWQKLTEPDLESAEGQLTNLLKILEKTIKKSAKLIDETSKESIGWIKTLYETLDLFRIAVIINHKPIEKYAKSLLQNLEETRKHINTELFPQLIIEFESFANFLNNIIGQQKITKAKKNSKYYFRGGKTTQILIHHLNEIIANQQVPLNKTNALKGMMHYKQTDALNLADLSKELNKLDELCRQDPNVNYYHKLHDLVDNYLKKLEGQHIRIALIRFNEQFRNNLIEIVFHTETKPSTPQPF